MKKTLGIMAIVAILLVITVTFVSADQAGPIFPKNPPPEVEQVEEAEVYSAYFIEFESDPTVEGTNIATLEAEKAAFEADADAIGLDYFERFTFTTLWNGISISLDEEDVNKLYTLDSVLAVYPVVEVERPEVIPGNETNIANAKVMTGADIAQSELGFTGEGVKIAIMDTGVDYDHPDLGGCFGPGCKVFTGYDLVGDAYNYGLTPVPDPDPDDCAGHGTHVAGIAAADGTVVGVAPGALIGAYKVFGCTGSTDADIMLAAMEMILADRMDVLNMSIGAAFWGWPQYPTSKGATELVNQGVVVVASAGNSGDYGAFATGSPGAGREVISVASFENAALSNIAYAIVDEETVNGTTGTDATDAFNVPFIPMTYTGPIPTSGTEFIVYGGRGCDVDLPLLLDPNGKIALIERGACSFAEKAQNAIDAGATGVVIHNNIPGLFFGTLGAPLDGVTPVVGISQEDGMAIRALGIPTWTWTDQVMNAPNPYAGLIASSSSYGPAADLSLKPDIGAPGAFIYSTVPLEQGGYDTYSGTSMASPHVAGAAALMLEAHPFIRPDYMRFLLQNTADPVDWWGYPGIGYLEPSFRQGAGMLDIDDAILARDEVVILPGKLSLGEGSKGITTHNLTIRNFSDEEKVFYLDWYPGVSTEGVVEIENYWITDEVFTFSQNPVVVPAGWSKTVQATVTPPTVGDGVSAAPWNTLYGGWITVYEMPDELAASPEEGDLADYVVPYGGFVGDFQDISYLTNDYWGDFLPVIGWTPDGSSYSIVPEGAVFTMVGNDVPSLLFHLDHQSPRVIVEIVNSMTGRRAFPIYSKIWDWDFFGRNSTSSSFFAEAWDGTRILWNHMMDVPDGSYQMRVRVLKAEEQFINFLFFGEWEEALTQSFVIDRP